MNYVLTQKEVDKLRERLVQLDEESKKISLEMKELIENDRDAIDNNQYQLLKKRINVEIPHEKDDILKKLNDVTIVDDSDYTFDGETVSICTKVTLDYEGEIESLCIMPICENDLEKNWVKCDAPIAKLILGKKKGDVVRLRNINVKILNVEKC